MATMLIDNKADVSCKAIKINESKKKEMETKLKEMKLM
jgi:hypothetical protein